MDKRASDWNYPDGSSYMGYTDNEREEWFDNISKDEGFNIEDAYIDVEQDPDNKHLWWTRVTYRGNYMGDAIWTVYDNRVPRIELDHSDFGKEYTEILKEELAWTL